MKNVFKLIAIIFLCVPAFIKADTYNQSEKIADNLMQKNDFRNTYERFIITGKYEGNFYGGLLSKEEFIATLKSNKNLNNNNTYSYLYDGTKYWTNTSNNNGKKYVVGINDSYLDVSSTNPKTRVVEYIQPDVVVTGVGTLSEPWIFQNKFKVVASSNDITKGVLSSAPCVNNTGSKTLSLIEGSVTSGYLCPKSGYKYIDNTCESIININNNNISIHNVNRDITCTINFGIETYSVELQNKDGEITIEPSILYLAYSKGWYKDKAGTQSIKKLQVVSSKPGNTFFGYYTGENGTGTKIIDNNGNIISGSESIVNQNTVLYPYFKEHKLTIKYNVNGGSLNSNGYTAEDSLIYLDGNLFTTKLNYTDSLTSDGLINPDNTSAVNITKTGYIPKKGSEWCTESDGTGTCYDDSKIYTNSELCPGISTSDCTVTYYVNWAKAKIIYSDHLILCNSGANSAYDMTYTSSCIAYNDGNENWRIKFLNSGTLILNNSADIDLFLVGGGNGGGSGSGNECSRYGGRGGNGGAVKTVKNISVGSNTSNYITVGAGGAAGSAGGVSTAFGQTSSGGSVAGGGSGAYTGYNGWGASYWGYGAGAPGNGFYEFGEASGSRYGGGGGGGGADASCRYDGSAVHFGSYGGAGGGGNGHWYNGYAYSPATNGIANTGGGGGGGHLYAGPKSGGSGIVIIRNKR